MGLLSTTVEIGITGRTAIYFEKLGYEIPRYTDRHGYSRVKNGTKIIVNIKDLSHGSSAKVDIVCDCCQKQYTTTYNNYNLCNREDKTYCRDCAIKLFNTGENSRCYKKDKTKEERERKRLYPEYYQFVKRVLARDNYTCQCCNIDNEYMEVHHLDGYEWCKEKRVDETNAITLCKNCHSNFHAIYGKGNNTRMQFEEWLNFSLKELTKYEGDISSTRKIYCYEENKIYNGATEFIRIHHLKATSTVYFVCNRTNFCKTIKGFHLFWYDEYIHMDKKDIEQIVNEPTHKNSRKVICLTTNTIYESVAKGAKLEQASSTSIDRCCRNIYPYARTKDGRMTKWMFYEDYIKLKESEDY